MGKYRVQVVEKREFWQESPFHKAKLQPEGN